MVRLGLGELFLVPPIAFHSVYEQKQGDYGGKMRLQKQSPSQHQGITYPVLTVLWGVLKAGLLDFIKPPFPGPAVYCVTCLLD